MVCMAFYMQPHFFFIYLLSHYIIIVFYFYKNLSSNILYIYHFLSLKSTLKFEPFYKGFKKLFFKIDFKDIC